MGGMFGDLNKLNTKQEKPKQEPQQPMKQAVKAVPMVPIATTLPQTNTEPLSREQPEVSQQHRSNVRTNERTAERTRVRHSFDIFNDQLMSLKEIALSRQIMFGSKTLLGDLVQEALDLFITKERNKE